MESVLTKAVRLARKKKFTDAEQLLDGEVIRYRESYNFYYTLGLCYLKSGNIGAAHDHLLRAREIQLRNPNVLLALGALYLKRADTRNAIRYYLEVQEVDPKNKIAAKALSIIKKYGASDDLIAWTETGKLNSLHPKFMSVPIRPASIIISAFILIFIFAATGGVLKILTKDKPDERTGAREASLNTEEKNNPTELGGVYNYILTEKEVLDAYKNAIRLFNEGRDNAVRFELNKIYNSNANKTIKNKADILTSYLNNATFDNLKDNYDYAVVEQEPILYKNCFVIWRGMATNVQQEQNSTSFEFLIGYETRKKLEGTVKVFLPYAASINTEQSLEVLAKVVADNNTGFSLEGSSIHQLPLGKTQ
jgi:tetratricopeptide (TPR) repeat protein